MSENNFLDGRIIKGIAGFYYVYVDSFGVVECHAKGILRKGTYRPLVGDNVCIEILDKEKMTGSLVKIYERKNSCIRPEVANVDQAVIVFAYESPAPNLLLMDRFLVTLDYQRVDCIICFNKLDICDDAKRHELMDIYSDSGYRVIEISAKADEGLNEVRALLEGKVTVLAGPSGVGKSSLINMLHPKAKAETGEVSKKSDRGKHTTRHSELFYLGDDTYIMDTPGFTALEFLDGIEKDNLKGYYREFYEYEGGCRFDPCSHTHEPQCQVKQAVEEGVINKLRYENYVSLYNELKDRRRY